MNTITQKRRKFLRPKRRANQFEAGRMTASNGLFAYLLIKLGKGELSISNRLDRRIRSRHREVAALSSTSGCLRVALERGQLSKQVGPLTAGGGDCVYGCVDLGTSLE